ncbi:competence type IV pilus minor pilin ComGD [Priestia taiwanensis]|uniref:Competence protein ComG n=1 Tax=Priestia taiwanensis TaxID=1347902 RepID=A0A917ATR3_9BACI|nr:competence type IV pilus minor pilin ComGD [Priestia taiwanensis]MBM7363812.1 competence protein ComGD [Priestia taiwanensis]GGE73914.1 competence protein ComG [Priestia taiwanensis]
MQSVNNNKGFTFVEMLLVLFIVSVVSSFVFVNISTAYDKRKIDHFMEQFYIDLLYTQEYAMSHYVDMKVHLRDGHYEIRGSSYAGPTILKRTYDDGIQVDVMTMQNPIVFKPSGNIERAGSLFVGYKGSRFKVVFQLGRGRVYYEKIR